jgi:hypothetical protein
MSGDFLNHGNVDAPDFIPRNPDETANRVVIRMTRWLNVWKIIPLAFPADPALATKIWTAMTDRV